MARERLNKWAIPHVLDALPSTDADGAIGAVFLVESFDALVERGVPKEKLLAKLRRDRDVWPTWAEIRAGGLLSAHSPDDMELVAEPGRGAGRHPDYALRYSTGERVAVEFKALGLSDEEVAFSQSAKPLLPQLIPPQHGIVTAHIEGSEIRGWPNRETRRRYKADAAPSREEHSFVYPRDCRRRHRCAGTGGDLCQAADLSLPRRLRTATERSRMVRGVPLEQRCTARDGQRCAQPERASRESCRRRVHRIGRDPREHGKLHNVHTPTVRHGPRARRVDVWKSIRGLRQDDLHSR